MFIATKHGKLQVYFEGFLSYCHMTFNQMAMWQFARSCDNLKNLYPNFCKKASGFLMFSGDLEKDQLYEMG